MANLTMPNVGEGITEGTVTKWLKAEGDAVARDEAVVEIETDKAVVEIPSPFAGQLVRILVAEDETVPIGEPLAEFELAEGEREPAVTEAATPVETGSAVALPAEAAAGDGAAPRRTRRYSPVVLKLAAERDIDLELVAGSGVGGRVTKKDVLRHLDEPVAPATGIAASPESPPRAGEAVEEGAERVALTATRRSIARHMSQSHQTIPVAWMAMEVDVTDLVSLRERAKDEFERAHGVRLTYLPFFVQAIVASLRQHPALNASYADDAIQEHRSFHMGIAVAVEAGLLVPVVRDADQKSIAGLSTELDELAQKARDRKLTLQEMQGATLTIDNTGAFGSLISKPIVPMGQVAIVATEAIRRELRVNDDGSFAPRSVMNLSISFDHRALDGAQAGRFLGSVRGHLEAFRPEQAVY